MTAHGRLTLAALAIVLLAPWLGGCQEGEHQVTFTTADGAHRYFQRFNHACIGADRHGEFDIVLFNDLLYDPAQGSGSMALSPTPVEPLRQVIRLHVFWEGARGNVVREASVTNASVVWYLMDDAAGKPAGVLTYEGAGFVRVDAHNGYADIVISDGRVKLASAKGNVRDAIGPAVLNGNFRAVTDSRQVRQMVRRMDDLSLQ